MSRGRGVAVDGDGVEGVRARLSTSSACSTGAAIGASVKTKDSIVAMSGAIMPAPLAMPLMVTVAPPSCDLARGALGVGVGGHDRRAPRRARRRAPPVPRYRPAPRRTCAGSSGSPITPVEARNTSLRPAADDLGHHARRQPRRFAPALAGEGVGIAGIDQQRPRLARGKRRLAPLDRRRRAFRPGEDAGDLGALVEEHEQHVAAVAVLDAGLGRGKAHPADRRQRRKGRRRQRRNRAHAAPVRTGRLLPAAPPVRSRRPASAAARSSILALAAQVRHRACRTARRSSGCGWQGPLRRRSAAVPCVSRPA